MIILEVPVGVLYDSKYNRYNCNIYPLSPPNIYKALFQATIVCLLLLEKDIHVISIPPPPQWKMSTKNHILFALYSQSH